MKFGDMNQIGLLLQILGFLMVAIIAGIILEKGFTKNLSVRISELMFMICSSLDRATAFLGRITVVRRFEILRRSKDSRNVELLSSFRITMFTKFLKDILSYLAVLIFLIMPIVLLVVGSLSDIQWLFWTGIAIMALGYVGITYSIFLVYALAELEEGQESTLSGHLRRMWLSLVLTVTAHLTLIIVNIYELLMLCLLLVIMFWFKLFQMLLLLLSGHDTLKKALVVIGVIAAITGLILQYIAGF